MSSPSASTSTLAERPEAEPLPKKVGEIGYIPPKSPEIRPDSQSTEEPTLPARHPADRLEEQPQPSESTSTTPAASTTTAAAAANNATNSSNSSVKKSWRQRLTVGGVSVVSILRIVLLLAFLAGTATAWGITIKIFSSNDQLSDSGSSSSDSSNGNGGDDSSSDSFNGGNGSSTPPSFSSLVILHVSFTVVTLVELLFLERAIFHARAERFLFKHNMPLGAASGSMGFAPWSRPPLPTYAAALAESGVRTGDVEDNLIAIPPPPAYGNTRGSVLLLQGYLRDSLVRNLNRISQRSTESRESHPITPREMEEGRRSRPISYEASEEVDNARRAMDLEAALAKLESGEKDEPKV